MNVFILGSCVTRDIFRVVGEGAVVDYYARTTVKSMLSEPLEVGEIELQSEFQKRIVRRDFEKTLFADLAAFEFDYFIVDFIDERFEILRHDNRYVTRSAEFVNAKLETLYPFEKVVKSMDDWKADAKKFVDRLLSIVPKEKVILHEAYWANKYIENDEIKEYPNQSNIDRNNEVLKQYYAYFRELTSCSVIHQPDFIGDAKHTWGLTPFHYTDSYYHDVYDQLRA